MTERNVQRGNRNPDERGIPNEQIIPNETVILNATMIPNETRIPVPNIPIVENRPTNQNAINPKAELLVLLRQQMQQQHHQQQMQMLLETFANQRPQTSSLKPYGGTTDFAVYQTQFELIARDEGWSEQEKVRRMYQNLIGSAATVLQQLSLTNTPATYANLAAVLNKQFAVAMTFEQREKNSAISSKPRIKQ